jgi:hypothetical protein
MARRFPALLLFLTSLACGIRATAHSVRPEPGVPRTDVSLSLGHSMLPLYGPWKFHVGYSPIEPATNQPLWAQPDFDDATWETVDLTPAGADNPLVPGWGKSMQWRSDSTRLSCHFARSCRPTVQMRQANCCRVAATQQ